MPRSRSRVLLTASVAALTLSALSSAAFAAAGPRLHDGRVLARGAAAEFGITLKCPEGWRGELQLSVVQVVENKKFASGGAYRPSIQCTGENQHFTLHAQANNGGPDYRPFRVGPASVSGVFQSHEVVDAPQFAGPYLPLVGPVVHHQQREAKNQHVKGVVDLR